LAAVIVASCVVASPAHADACVDNQRCWAIAKNEVSGSNGFHAAQVEMAPICKDIGQPSQHYVNHLLWAISKTQSATFIEAGIRWGVGTGGIIDGFHFSWTLGGLFVFVPTGVTPTFGTYYPVSISWVSGSSWNIRVPGHTSGTTNTGMNAPAQILETGLETDTANTQGWGASRMLGYTTRQGVFHDGWDTATGTDTLIESPSSTYVDALWISQHHHLHYKTVPSC
ncbi:MAG TPA: hypothetical protein VE972_09090, partial [Conexibacter sp.]|nr:hypothetical protein [Conexibacter sp.]